MNKKIKRKKKKKRERNEFYEIFQSLTLIFFVILYFSKKSRNFSSEFKKIKFFLNKQEN